ncbi:MAG: CBS domain-containing protein [Nitrosomonadales bacterium]|mgnify:CR=1 FL=1|jgi:CBS domain-containing protein|nr:MAG: histidine kinase [Methylophilales bacterium BACL14 MAG-120910-bin43]KRP08180.1 MAG: histidine kinase [Methylophilales bacterium BACL14 MAG-120920-bin58]MBT6392554.1 CBS domain-containing protein [Nitrosomonadales bacterium]|tara:strand:+ start:246 stop:677 length:432 start_codon:yes stop_codon:yes gene_type:complete
MKTLQQLIKEKDIQELLSIEPSQTLTDALTIMAEYKIGALLVMKNKKMVGIVSERDYAREVVLKKKSPKTTLVEDIMTRKIISLSGTDSFEKGLEVMTERRIRHLPVMQDEEILGMVSIGDLVKEMIAHQKHLISQLESFIQS